MRGQPGVAACLRRRAPRARRARSLRPFIDPRPRSGTRTRPTGSRHLDHTRKSCICDTRNLHCLDGIHLGSFCCAWGFRSRIFQRISSSLHNLIDVPYEAAAWPPRSSKTRKVACRHARCPTEGPREWRAPVRRRSHGAHPKTADVPIEAARFVKPKRLPRSGGTGAAPRATAARERPAPPRQSPRRALPPPQKGALSRGHPTALPRPSADR
jgi:hypothetical protein